MYYPVVSNGNVLIGLVLVFNLFVDGTRLIFNVGLIMDILQILRNVL